MVVKKYVKALGVILIVVAVLAANVATVAAAPLPEGEEQDGVFGVVTAVEGDVIHVRTKGGDVLQVQVTSDTQFQAPEEEMESLDAINPGDRVAILVVDQDGVLVAQIVMVIPRQVRVVHIIGAVTEVIEGMASVVTEDGRRVPVAFGLNRSIPEPGTVVTIVGNLDPETRVVQARSVQRLDKILERLSDHVDEIQNIVPDRDSQVQHLVRVQRMLERTSERQLQILNEVVEHLPDEARPALERALQNLHEANEGVILAFNKALELAGESEREQERPEETLEGYHLPEDVEPSLHDIAAVLGISEDALIERLGQGLTLAQVAQEVGLAEDVFVDGILARVRDRLMNLVEDGQLRSGDVDAIIDAMRSEADYHLHRVFSNEDFRPTEAPFSVEDLAQILDMETPELFARLQAGRSLLQVAQDRGFSREQLLERIMGLAQRRAQRLVDQGALLPQDIERFLLQFREDIEHQIEEVSQQFEVVREGQPITPEDVASILGIKVRELLAHFEGGGTLRQLARRHELTVEQLLTRIMEQARANLAHQVETGHISPDEVAQILARLEREFLEELDRSTPATVVIPEERPIEFEGAPFDLEVIARALGLSPQELHRLLAEGFTPAKLAEERGIPLRELVQHIIVPMENKLGAMVEAGYISQDEVRVMLQGMREGALRALEQFRISREGEPYPDEQDFRPDPSLRPYPDIPLTLADAARILGVSFEEMMERMGDDGHVREFLEERGFTLERFAATLLDLVHQRLSRLVAQGELSEEQVAHMLRELKQRLLQDLGGPHTVQADLILPDSTFERPPEEAIPFNFGEIARILGISHDRLEQLISQGYTVAEITEKAGISLEQLAKGLITPLEARIQNLLAEGYISKEDAIARLEEARIAILRALKEFRASRPGDIYLSDEDVALNITDQPTPSVDVDIALDFSLSLHQIAGILGLSPEEFSRFLAEGFTVRQVAEKMGTSLEDLAYLLMNATRAKLYGLVEAGNLSEEEAAKLLQYFHEQVKSLIAELGPPTGDISLVPIIPGDTYQGDISILPNISGPEAIFEVLGIDLEKVRLLTADGLTIAEAAYRLGLDPVTVFERVNAFATERINTAIREEILSEEEAALILGNYQAQTKELIDKLFTSTSNTFVVPGETTIVDSTALLPFLPGPEEVFVTLGIDLEKVRLLTAEGLTIAEAAYELGLDPQTILQRLNTIAQERMATALQEGYLGEQDAVSLLYDFQIHVEELVAKYFVLASTSGTSSGETYIGDTTDSETTTTESTTPDTTTASTSGG
ncbi:MAG: hypothetical protein ACE5JL_00335 [Dehalococcoidia bacterium]